MTSMSFTERPLFGGAISAEIPSHWIDVSDIRQVPDHQECYQETLPFNAPNDPGLVVVEILKREADVNDQDAARHFFYDLAESNGTRSQSDLLFQAVPPPFSVAMAGSVRGDTLAAAGESVAHILAGVGFQKVAMGADFDVDGNSRQGKQEIKWVQVDLCVFRLPTQDTDLLVTHSKPVPASGEPNGEPSLPLSMSPVLNHVISTLKIRDWELFG